MSCNSSRLILYFGDEVIDVPKFDGTTFFYSIGSAVDVNKSVSVNNSTRLNQIALEYRDSYSKWIYSMNQSSVHRGLVSEGLSLFLVSDCSAKRTELFPTYSFFCNLKLIQEIVRERRPDEILVVNANKGWVKPLLSVVGEIPVVVLKEKTHSLQTVKRLLSDLRFLFHLLVVVCLNVTSRRRRVAEPFGSQRMFFSIYPKMIDDQGIDRKYRESVGNSDNLAVTILTDGYHQRVSINRYSVLRAEIVARGAHVIDDYLGLTDWTKCLYWLVSVRLKVKRLPKQYLFSGIDLSSWIKDEMKQSASRIARFMALKGGFNKFFKNVKVDEFVYYLHEYPLGRLISWVLAIKHPDVTRIGFQHGPCAWRKMVYSLSPGEVGAPANYSIHVPIPDKVYAEDSMSAKIYRYSGFKDVQIMTRIFRLDYLDDMTRDLDADITLIAPGLNDGPAVLKTLWAEFIENESCEFLIKPHPLANNDYIKEDELPKNVRIAHQPVYNLLPKVKKLYVTYSSVGCEAARLGIPVSLVEVPGQINESPLLDSPHEKYSLTIN